MGSERERKEESEEGRGEECMKRGKERKKWRKGRREGESEGRRKRKKRREPSESTWEDRHKELSSRPHERTRRDCV